jgi:hypothetical protein
MNDKEQFWFNTKTKEVEKGLLSAALYRIGPFGSRAEAERAEEVLRERSRAWAKEDQDSDRKDS